jgi:hypothetical protein
MINSVKAMVIVGCTLDELKCSPKFPPETDWNSKIAELGLTISSPYVGGIGEGDVIIGLVFAETDQFKSLEIDLMYSDQAVPALEYEFKELTGVWGKTYLLPVIT